MHTLFSAIAFYASISTVVSTAIFIFYLEIFEFLTGFALASNDNFGWRSLIAKVAVITAILSGLIGAIASILTNILI